MIYRRILHILLNILATIIFLTSLTSCIVIANEINYAAGGYAHLQILPDVLIVSPILFVVLLIATYFIVKACMRMENQVFTALIAITFINIFLILFLVVQTFDNEHGLWVYKNYYSHNNSSQYDFYFFHPYVGIIGIYISTFSHFFYRFVSRMQENPSFVRACFNLTTFLPVALYFMIVYWQELIPKPSRFIG